MVRGHPQANSSLDHIWINKQHKKGWHLPSKRKALSVNPSATKKQNKQKNTHTILGKETFDCPEF
jgi:hypothetical protein